MSGDIPERLRNTDLRTAALVAVALSGLAFFPTFLFTDNLRNLALILFGLSGLAFLIFRRRTLAEFQPEAGRMIIVFALFFLVALAAWWWGGMSDLGTRKLGRVGNVLFLAPFLAAFAVSRPRIEWVWLAMAIGGMVAGLWTTVLLVGGDGERIAGGSHVMTVGGLSLAAAFALLAALPSLWQAGWRWLVLACAIGALGYLLANLGSGVRGPWLALPVLLLAWVLWYAVIQRRWKPAVGGVAVALGLALVLPFVPHIDRLDRVASEVNTWFAAEGALPARDERAGLGCLAEGEWLRAYFARAQVRPEGKNVEADIQPWLPTEENLLEGMNCSGSHIVQLHNHESEAVRIDLPRSALTRGEDFTRFSVAASGEGEIHVTRTDHMETLGPAPMTFDLEGDEHSRLQLRMEPGTSMRVLPLEGRRGELMYFHAGGPVGERLEMWTAALAHYRQAPILGVGYGVYPEYLESDIAERRVAPWVADQAHPHNEWLYALSSRGLPGILVLLALFLYPLLVLSRSATRGASGEAAAGAAGASFIVTTGVFGLTQGIFDHNLMVNAYTFFVVTTFYLSRVSTR